MTTTKAYDILRKNFIIANYNSLGAVDNDDGSSYYKSESNFFVYGGGGLKNEDNFGNSDTYAEDEAPQKPKKRRKGAMPGHVARKSMPAMSSGP